MMIAAVETAAAAGILMAALSVCPNAPDARIETHFENKPPQIVRNLSTKDLTRLSPQSQGRHGHDASWVTGGLTHSDIRLKLDVQFGGMRDDRTKTTCVWITSAHMNVVYQPVIYIAQEFSQSPCRSRETLAHEQRHVGVDVQTLNDYLPLMRQNLEQAARGQLQPTPFPTYQEQKARQILYDTLASAVKNVWDTMGQVRAQRQAAIDTPAEYARLSKACR